MAIQGDLYDFSLTDLIWFLDNRQKSGWLTLEHASARMIFTFRADEWCAVHMRSSMLRLNPAISAETSRLTDSGDCAVIRALMRGPHSYRDLISTTGKTPEAVLEIITRLQATGMLFIAEPVTRALAPPNQPALVA